jgi:heterodisulfide reductase subunit A
VFLAYDNVKLDPVVAVVDPYKCRECGTCVDLCPFHAPTFIEEGPMMGTVEINASLCKGCGTCGSWCPSGAIVCEHFTDRQVTAMIDAFFDEEPQARARPGEAEPARAESEEQVLT